MRCDTLLLAGAMFVAGCSSSSDDGAGGTGGRGGAGGDGCPEGSHEVDDGCDATMSAWKETGALSEARDHHISFIAETKQGKPYFYVIGGMVDQQTLLDQAERAVVNEDGSLGAWETLTRMPRTMAGHGFAKVGKTLIFAGGFGGIGRGTNAVDLVTLADDGSLTDYRDGPALKEKRLHVSLEAHGDDVFAVGGFGTTDNTPTIERTTVKDGKLSAWSDARPMPEKRSHHASASSNQGLYVVGGIQGNPAATNVTLDSVIYAPFEEDGALGEWQTLTPLPNPTSVMSAFVFADWLWVVGGLDETRFLKTVIRARIAKDGTVGAWEEQPSLPKVRGHVHQIPIFGGRLYNAGGFSSSGSQDAIFSAELK
jgi:hypothetical protein